MKEPRMEPKSWIQGRFLENDFSRGQAQFFDCLRTVKQGSVYPTFTRPWQQVG